MSNKVKQYLELIEDGANIGYWSLDLEKDTIFWSDGVYKIHGVTPENFSPDLKNVVKFYHPDDRAAVLEKIDESISQKTGNSFDLRIIHRNGDIRHVKSNFKCELNNNNDVIGLYGIFQDITQQVQRSEEIKESRNFLKAVIDNAPDMIFVKDQESRIILGNKAFLDLYDKPEEEVVGTTDFKKFPRKQDQITFRVGQSEIEEEITNKNDVTKIYTTKRVALTRSNGQKFLLGASRDITQRRIYESKIKDYSAQLETRNKNLEKSNEALEEFAHTAAHDLKEPIRSIHNYVEMIIYDHPDLEETVKIPLQKVMRVAWRMSQMVSELLLLSEINQVISDFSETDLNKVVSNELIALEARLEQTNAVVKCEKLPTVVCHPTRVGEIFRNLIVNGIKYNESKEKIIKIGSFKEDNKVIFFVKDNGIGIKDAHKGEIFKLFKRLHGKMDYGGGTGIGLAVTKKIINLHSGKIWVESKKDQGTTFYFTLQEVGDNHG